LLADKLQSHTVKHKNIYYEYEPNGSTHITSPILACHLMSGLKQQIQNTVSGKKEATVFST